MILLTREVRFSLADSVRQLDRPISNSWAGSLASDRLLPYLILRCTMSGEVDSRLGYFCNVKSIDELLRQQAVRALVEQAQQTGGPLTGAGAIQIAWDAICDDLPEATFLERLELKATPFLRYELRRENSMVRVTQQFEFSASHRLHCDHLSDEENRQLFGKCNNVHGHGHNYRVDVTIRHQAEDPTTEFPLTKMETIVRETVIDRFDHKHLNLDTPEFAELNPTVENIAKVIWGLLESQFSERQLYSVRVFETPKTWAEYFGAAGEDAH